MGAHFHIKGVGAEFLASTDVVDWYHADVHRLAWLLAGGANDPVEIAMRCFEWVRDEIRHSMDARDTQVTCAASEVLTHRTGFCYAKSHLLAALLRANNIPAGFCYQRLAIAADGGPLSLHGLNAVHLPNIGWYRIDPRGNKPGVLAAFSPPRESLAFAADGRDEQTLPQIWSAPLQIVVDALRRHANVADLAANLPDLTPVASASMEKTR